MYEYIIRAFQLCLEPAIACAHVYISLVYAIRESPQRSPTPTEMLTLSSACSLHLLRVFLHHFQRDSRLRSRRGRTSLPFVYCRRHHHRERFLSPTENGADLSSPQFPLYILYQKKRIEPLMGTSEFTPEIRLEVALIGSFFIPVSLFLFGWSAREGVHW